MPLQQLYPSPKNCSGFFSFHPVLFVEMFAANLTGGLPFNLIQCQAQGRTFQVSDRRNFSEAKTRSFSNGATKKKKTALLSMKSWLVHRDPFNDLYDLSYLIPIYNWVGLSSPIYPKQFFHCSIEIGYEQSIKNWPNEKNNSPTLISLKLQGIPETSATF